MTDRERKDFEQAAFEEWLNRTCPSGDVVSVQRQWEASSECAALYAAANRPPGASTMTPETLTSHTGFTLNDEQQSALDSMLAWLADDFAVPYFVLQGYAGTGKTFTCKALVEQVKGRVCFTAPTNKAVKVLRETLTTDTYRPQCATIYSLLGLRMEANGEVKELKGRDKDDEDKLDLSMFKFVVVDEGSMVNKILREHIDEAQKDHGVKFLFMGDPAQLPPVGEVTAPIWKMDAERAVLTQVMRHDNQILNLVTRIRKVVDDFSPRIDLKGDHDVNGGVWVLREDDFKRKIIERANVGAFADGKSDKIIAWRNVKVNEYNALVRAVMFDKTSDRWVPDDRVIFTAPAKDLDDKPMARTDDEGLVTHVRLEYHPVYSSFKCHRLAITLDDGRLVTGFALAPESQRDFDQECTELAARKQWRDFWALKEGFHGLRHAYAITAHRAQGSTYRTVFVDYKDILLNRTRQEAYRCLYVACSRPTTNLILG